MQTIFNATTGEPRTVDSVDARELIETGRWMASPAPTVEPIDAAVGAFADMKFGELKALCETSGIPVPDRATKAQLLDLLEQATASSPSALIAAQGA